MNKLLQNKRIIYIAVAIIILIAVLFISGILNFSKVKRFLGGEEVVVEPDVNLMTNRNAYDIALLEVQKWQIDAKLAYMNTDSVSTRGRSNIWKLIFISKNTKEKGFLVEIEDYKIISASEIFYSGAGADFPTNILSSEDAIKMVRMMKGYENVEIYGVEVINMGNLWYWGVKTSKGVVSVKSGK